MRNPFYPVKATELSDQDVHELWVSPGGEGVPGVLRPVDTQSYVVKGAKGCGKTHILRWHSAEVQALRHHGDLAKAILAEQFLGVYILCRTADAGRFTGDELTDAQWRGLFGYYLELVVAESLVGILHKHLEKGFPQKAFAKAYSSLLTAAEHAPMNTVVDVLGSLRQRRRELDHLLNNILYESSPAMPEIVLGPGAACFGLTQVVMDLLQLGDAKVLLMIDEIENLSASQQEILQDRIRHHEGPVALRVCGRPYGFRTWSTSTGEANRERSEFKVVNLAKEFWGRGDAGSFEKAMAKVCNLRIQRVESSGEGIEKLVEKRPGTRSINELVRSSETMKKASPVRFRRLRRCLDKKGVSPQLSESFVQDVQAQPPLRQHSLVAAVCSDKVDFAAVSPFRTAEVAASKLESHYSSDFCVQLVEETGTLHRQWEYCGWREIIRLADMNPRTLINVLDASFDWSEYTRRGVKPRLSVEDQAKGILAVSRSYVNAAVENDHSGAGERARRGIRALCKAMAALRRADVPIEPSLCAFSVPAGGISRGAEEALEHGVLYGLLRQYERKLKNDKVRSVAYQIAPPVCPLYGIPSKRRGTLSLQASVIELFFGHEQRLEDGVRELLNRSRRKDENVQETLFQDQV